METDREVEKGEKVGNIILKGKIGQAAVGRRDSVGTIEESCKRKRDGSGDESKEGGSNKKAQKDMIGIILEEIRGMKVEGRMGREEVREGIEGIKREIVGITIEMRMKEEKWEKEKEEMVKKIDKLEKSIRESRSGGKIEKRIRKIEENIEREERLKRRRNLIFKGIREDSGRIREGVENICREIGVSVGIDEVKEVKAGKEEKRKMVIVKLNSEGDKKKILTNKGKLKGKEI